MQNMQLPGSIIQQYSKEEEKLRDELRRETTCQLQDVMKYLLKSIYLAGWTISEIHVYLNFFLSAR